MTLLYGLYVYSHLLLTDTHLIILRHAPERGEGKAYMQSRRPLQNVIKITSKRKLPELIGFQYGRYRVLAAGDRDAADGSSELVLEGADRLLIPRNAGDAVRFVKQAVVRLTETAPAAADTTEAVAVKAATPASAVSSVPASSSTATAETVNGGTASPQPAADSSQSPGEISLSVAALNSHTSEAAAISPTTDSNSSSA